MDFKKNVYHAKTTTKKAPRMASAKNPTKMSMPELLFPELLLPDIDLKVMRTLASFGCWRLT